MADIRGKIWIKLLMVSDGDDDDDDEHPKAE